MASSSALRRLAAQLMSHTGKAVCASALSVSFGAATLMTKAAPSAPLPAETVVPKNGREQSTQLLDCIGNTPLLELHSLSAATGCRILAKAEFMNPGGSVKDRPALNIILEHEAAGRLTPRHLRKPGEAPGIIIEATGGNTGLGMALVAAARGYRCIFTMPGNISKEKIELMQVLGAETVVCTPVPFSDESHYYHRAAALVAATPGAVHGNQFEGLANMRAHVQTTGPEIWKQAGGKVDALVCAAGTGGTIGGLSTFLKSVNPHVKVFVIDPPGSSLAQYIASHGASMTATPGTTITEGIGINRITANFKAAHVDASLLGSDQEALDMAYYLLRREGVFVGPSAALNVTGAVKVARLLGPGHTIVTVLCDGGERYRSKMYNPAWLRERGMTVSVTDFARDHADFVK